MKIAAYAHFSRRDYEVDGKELSIPRFEEAEL